jgi:YMGG-like Gly-zipper
MIGRSIRKSAVVTLISATILLGSVAPAVFGQDRRCRSRNYEVTRYERGRAYDSRYYDDYRGSNYYWDDQNTPGKAAKRVGIGTGIGAVAGALLGGGKGAVIGGGIGAAGGYIYHRRKVDEQRDRYYGRY